jgi:hypothetical protein
MMGVLALRPEEMEKVRAFEHWGSPHFLLFFFMASIMGSVLNYSTFLCTAVNSALTTTVVGCLKNVLTTYLGMVFLADYKFSWSNFVGLNISIGGSLMYSVAEFAAKQSPRKQVSGHVGASVGVRASGPPETTYCETLVCRKITTLYASAPIPFCDTRVASAQTLIMYPFLLFIG